MPAINVLDADLAHAATKLKLTAKGDGKFDPSKCKYKLIINGEAQAPKAMTAAGTVAVASAPLRAVKEDELNYKVTWALVYEGKDYPQTENWIVWPETIKVVIKNEDGSKPVPKVRFVWTANGKSTDYVTNDAGEHLVRAKTADWLVNGFTITLKSGWKDKKNSPGTGRVRTYHAKNVAIAEFVSPKAEEKPTKIKQWVNLTPDEEHPDRGHEIKIKVGYQEGLGSKDDEVFIKTTFGMESKRNKPKPELKGVLGISSKNDNGKQISTASVKLGENGAPAEFSVELGLAGKCTCQVDIGTTSECKDASIIFTNWRKIYYHYTRTAKMAKGSVAKAQTAFEKVGIEIEEYEVPSALLTEGDIPANALVDAELLELGKAGKIVVIGDHNRQDFYGKFQPIPDTPCVHIILCDYVCLAQNQELDKDDIEVDWSKLIDFPPGSGNIVSGYAIHHSATRNYNAAFLAKDLRDGSHPVKECTWKCKEDPKLSGTIDVATHVLIDAPKYNNAILIKLPDDAAKILDDDPSKTILVHIRVAWAKWHIGGAATIDKRHILMPAGTSEDTFGGTMVHEVGHAMKQAAKEAAAFPGISPPPPHKRYYANRGHQGPHCAFGLDDATYNDKTKDLDIDNAPKVCECIMFGALSSKMLSTMSFCSLCEPYVIAADIHEISKP